MMESAAPASSTKTGSTIGSTIGSVARFCSGIDDEVGIVVGTSTRTPIYAKETIPRGTIHVHQSSARTPPGQRAESGTQVAQQQWHVRGVGYTSAQKLKQGHPFPQVGILTTWAIYLLF
mmetsp:Transcript_3284/g.5765  ORF Transcript_3284/g.5765 Transcript_3284/m.5765 type:complete len:119 (-) Transcript_3284:262-618(-)